MRDRLKKERSQLEQSGDLRTLGPMPPPPESKAPRFQSRFSTHLDASNTPSSRSLDPEDSPLEFTSNDYLGLAKNPQLWEQFLDELSALKSPKFGSTGSRLLSGDYWAVRETEQTLTSLYGRPALCFNSGYQANTGILQCLAGPSDVIFADKYCHASLLDGAVLSGAKLIRYRHQDLAHLTDLMTRHRSQYRTAFCITESIFSMEGTLTNIPELAAIKDRFDAVLYVDEAHGFGVRSTSGLGVAHEQFALNNVDILVGTFGKAGGSSGAFCITSPDIHAYLITRCRSFIYSTALPVPVWMWNRLVLNELETLTNQRAKLTTLCQTFEQEVNANRPRLEAQSIVIPTLQSHLVPVIIGDTHRTREIAQHLATHSITTVPIRTPTVPKGLSRLRISLTTTHTQADIRRLLQAIVTFDPTTKP